MVLSSHRCTCAMDGFNVPNDLHSIKCELWWHDPFEQGFQSWDAIGQKFCAPISVIAQPAPHSPWDNAEDYIWDGDTPVVSVVTATERIAPSPTPGPEFGELCAHEDEAVAAMCAGAQPDEYGWIVLGDGSWVDLEGRVTYRCSQDEDGADQWEEEIWDADPANTVAVECTCTPAKRYYCAACNVARDFETDPWHVMLPSDRTGLPKGTGVSSFLGPTCGHTMKPVVLPNDVNFPIFASALRRHSADGVDTPDLGLYAAESWNPSCPAIFIPWTDYGLPECDNRKAARAIKTAYDAAKAGDVVEVGCIGSHGRTGTILACMAIIANPAFSGPQAIAWVRQHHCHKAVECNSQEWFVRWFRAWFLGELDSFTEEEPGTWGGRGAGTWSKLPNGDWVCEDDTVKMTVIGPGPKVQGGGGTATTPFKFDPVSPLPKGQTANERRRNAKRAHRQQRALRTKKQNKRNGTYVNSSR